MSPVADRGTFHVPPATRNNDLRRREICRRELDLLENNNLRRRSACGGAKCPAKCPCDGNACDTSELLRVQLHQLRRHAMKLRSLILTLLWAALALPTWADEFQVLPDKVDGVPRGELLSKHLLDQADELLQKRKAEFEKIVRDPKQIAAYQERLRGKFREALGEFPERTPLNDVVTGRVVREGFTVEKVLFESRPKFFVTGAMFLPDAKKFPPPYPAVLVVCGHSANGKAYDGYQRATAMLALNGIAGFIIDPIGQGERVQLLNAEGKPQIPNPVDEHTLLGHGAVLLGRNTASFEIWDGMRAIDYLESRKDIDATKGVGCMGNSGGGTQTAQLMALDDRIACASPACYITSFEKLLHTIGPQDAEQNIFGQLRFGMNHADYVILRAPKPTLICSARGDYFNIDGARDSFAQAKQAYEALGHGEQIAMKEADGPHGWSQPLREAAVGWMVRWLRGEGREVKEPEIDVLTDAEMNVTPLGQVMLLDGAVSAFELNRAENVRLSMVRADLWTKDPGKALVESRHQLHRNERIQTAGKDFYTLGDNIEGERFRYRKLEFGLCTAIYAMPKELADETPVLYLDPQGKAHALRPDGPVEKLLAQGRAVLVVDIAGVGEAASEKGEWYNARFGSEGRNATVAYLLQTSALSIRTMDISKSAHIAIVSRWSEIEAREVDLIALGELGPPALHAAAFHPKGFRKVRIERSLASFASVVETPVVENQWVHMIHGALRVYDLPDLAASLGDKLELIEPVDASGKVIEMKK